MKPSPVRPPTLGDAVIFIAVMLLTLLICGLFLAPVMGGLPLILG